MNIATGKMAPRSISTTEKATARPNEDGGDGVTEDPKGYPVLVTELADCSLTKLVTQRSPQKPRLSAREKYSFILEIAQGIAYIHSCGYVHRDIKVQRGEKD